ncbi:hypothetical protein ABZX78_22895 [Streptomyces cellulosae]
MPHRVLLGVADPAQPLWHYAVDSRSRSWWRRARKVAEDTCLSPEARAIALRTARDHALIRHPDQLKPPPAETERGEALAWLSRHGGDRSSAGAAVLPLREEKCGDALLRGRLPVRGDGPGQLPW